MNSTPTFAPMERPSEGVRAPVGRVRDAGVHRRRVRARPAAEPRGFQAAAVPERGLQADDARDEDGGCGVVVGAGGIGQRAPVVEGV
eukprot:31420-Pelagococcus_subviridis.AAC.4